MIEYTKKLALVLSGGGAKAAYQVGVLKAIQQSMPVQAHSPFSIITGTSAGAINGLSVACYADDFSFAINHLEKMWCRIHMKNIYTVQTKSIRWFLLTLAFRLMLNKSYQYKNPALLNNMPLGALLKKVIAFDRLPKLIDQGLLHAVSINTSHLESGESVSFFQGHTSIEPWFRQYRQGKKVVLNEQHLLASSAIPFIFPAVNINQNYYVDGAFRQFMPLSSALHLGANKLLTIGVNSRVIKAGIDIETESPPSLSMLIKHMLNTAFLDNMSVDIERVVRTNRVLSATSEHDRNRHHIDLKKVEVLEILPSRCLNTLAYQYMDQLPSVLKRFVNKGSGQHKSDVMSYLLCTPAFIRRLIDMGYQDGKMRQDEIISFITE